MFFQESERLADSQPTLRELIARIDTIIYEAGPAAVFRTKELASYLQVKESQIQGVFQQLALSGLLSEVSMIECDLCGNTMTRDVYESALNEEEPLHCTQCERELGSKDINFITVFRKLYSLKTLDQAQQSRPKKTPADTSSRSFHESLPPSILQDPFHSAPLMRFYSQAQNLTIEQPLAGKRVAMILHFLRDLIPFVEACIRLGLQPQNTTLFYKEYPYPQREAVTEYLNQKGFKALPLTSASSYLQRLQEMPQDKTGPFLIIEDGGFLVPLLHTEYPQLLPHTIGAVEQTTRGIRNAEALERIDLPLLSIATSRLKGEFEPPYIAEAVVNNIKNLLPNMALRGKTAAVFGYGTIGQKLADWMRTNGVNVTVYEKEHEKRLKANQDAFNIAESPTQAAKEKKIVVGTSGRKSINSDVISPLTHDTHLVSASSEQDEIDIEYLEQKKKEKHEYVNDNSTVIGTTYTLPPSDRKIHLLANGYPINFWGMESMPEEASDLIMSLILLAAIELARGNHSNKGIDSDAVNGIAEEYRLAKEFLNTYKQG